MAISGGQTQGIEEQPSADEWEYKFIPALIGGVNLSERSESIKDDELLDAEGLRFEKGAVHVDYGYGKFGQVTRGDARASYEFFLKNGSSVLTLITDLTFYIWNESADEWQYVDNGTSTTLTASANSPDTSITVADITGFADGEFIGIKLDDGTQHRTTVNGTPSGSTINIDDAMPGLASSGNAVVEAVALSGDKDLGISIETWAAVDRMYFANGVDTPKQFDGTSVSDISNLPGSTFTCKVIRVFNDRLELMGTTEDGTNYPQRVRWSDAGDPTSWNASVNVIDLYDKEDFIISSERLGPYNIIYRERSIVRQSYVGADDQLWDFETMIESIGVVAPDHVVNLGDFHILFASTNLYEYRGDLDIQPIGDEIYDRIFSVTGDLNPDRIARAFSIYIEELDDMLFFYPKGSDDFCKNAVRMNLSTRAFSFRTFPVSFTGYGFFQSPGATTWATASGTWGSQTGAWVSKTFQANAPTLHLCGQSGQVYENNYSADDDDGTAISYTLVTKDFYVPNRKLRFDRYEFSLKGTSIKVEASYDRGTSWITLGTVTQTGAFGIKILYKQKIGQYIRFRFTGSDEFAVEWIGFRFKRESIW